MFLTATPLAFFVVMKREELKAPKLMVFLSLATLLSAVFVLIGLVSVLFVVQY